MSEVSIDWLTDPNGVLRADVILQDEAGSAGKRVAAQLDTGSSFTALPQRFIRDNRLRWAGRVEPAPVQLGRRLWPWRKKRDVFYAGIKFRGVVTFVAVIGHRGKEVILGRDFLRQHVLVACYDRLCAELLRAEPRPTEGHNIPCECVNRPCQRLTQNRGKGRTVVDVRPRPRPRQP